MLQLEVVLSTYRDFKVYERYLFLCWETKVSPLFRRDQLVVLDDLFRVTTVEDKFDDGFPGSAFRAFREFQ